MFSFALVSVGQWAPGSLLLECCCHMTLFTVCRGLGLAVLWQKSGGPGPRSALWGDDVGTSFQPKHSGTTSASIWLAPYPHARASIRLASLATEKNENSRPGPELISPHPPALSLGSRTMYSLCVPPQSHPQPLYKVLRDSAFLNTAPTTS